MKVDHFTDKEHFLVSVRSHITTRKKAGFTDQQIYRLKKICLKVKQDLHDDDDDDDDGW